MRRATGGTMRRHGQRGLVAAILGIVVLSATACVDERIVYRDVERDIIGELPANHANFVGLSDEETNLTVCGNCHVGFQGEWEQTAHADAWETLQASGHAQAFCEGCHTVNELGNVATEEGGWTTTSDTRYHNVQCESCHGPGLAHIQNPGDTNIPLAPLAVGLDMTIGCGECHQGTHHPFVEQWEQSAHGQSNLRVGEDAAHAGPAAREACAVCHTGEGVLASWGIEVDYLEQDDVVPGSMNPDEHLAITCAVCHDPHDNKYEGQLRFPVDAANEEQNLCMKCHHKRGTPDLASQSRGPHSPEGPVLLGYGGWWPPNMQFDVADGDTARIAATHGSASNPQLCAGCHVNRFDVTDQATGEFVMTSVGHLFEATPCLDAQGVPTAGDCAPAERTFDTCTGSGCHGSADVARSLQLVATQRLDLLAEQLNALIAQIPATEFNANDGRYSTGEGAKFNYQLHDDFPGNAVHNPFLLEALLIATIRQVQTDYGLSASATLSLERQLGVN